MVNVRLGCALSWESEAADLGLLGDARGGERSVRTARDTEKMNQAPRKVLLAKNARGHKRYHKMCTSPISRKGGSWRRSSIFAQQRHEPPLREIDMLVEISFDL